MVGFQDTALDHIVDTTGGTDNHLGAFSESLHVLTDSSTTNTSVAGDVHEVTDSNDDLLDLLSQLTGRGENEGLAALNIGVELLESGDGESGSLSSTRLGLSDNIATYIRSVTTHQP